ncbi:GPW/gp25 family protein [Microscilla marina]|uniref:Phage baseplate assembly protein W n=1 Tax=Microscilla marina ATCC 23134 TaxID=313606 RepID=A1ZC12_MICM2|nr:GPW/gp25 family protein [Microscilla marina]EAY31814.1 phage baseplate assembly protein W [Microscilla marina ATCC 23134]
MSNSKSPFLGTGWGFPPQFVAGGKYLTTTQSVENVHKSVLILLQTNVGERVMLEDFGGSLVNFQFEQVSTRLLEDIKDHVASTIEINEPRVRLDNVEVEQDTQLEGRLLVQLQYTIRSSNSRFNLVYPFYVTEPLT